MAEYANYVPVTLNLWFALLPQTIFILLDALDQLQSEDQGRLLSWMPEVRQRNDILCIPPS